MRVYGISDLHLSFASDKPMDRFGDIWIRHWEKIETHWRDRIAPEDIVLVPGDHSWGLRLDDAKPDLEFIANLPGTKILSKGNHDLWWHGLGKLQKLGLSGVHWLQNNAVSIGPLRVAGSRGWSLPGTEYCATDEDHATFTREVGRLKLSLEALPKDGYRIAMLHYPPLLTDLKDTEFTRLFESFDIKKVVYGHLHIGHLARAFQGEHHGIEYHLVSCDVNGFEPVKIVEVE